MAAEPGRRRAATRQNTVLIAVAAVTVVGLVVGLFIVFGPSSSADPDEPAPPPAGQRATTATPSPTPAATSGQSPYCAAYADIRAGGLETRDDEGPVDLPGLSRKFAELQKKYAIASKRAPESLRDDYATVLGYLKQGRTAVDSRNLDQIKLLVKSLGALNGTMSTIQRKSDKLCR